MTAVDDRPVIAPSQRAARHFLLNRLVALMLADPNLDAPDCWYTVVTEFGDGVTGQFSTPASLAARRAQVGAYASAFGLELTEKPWRDGKVRVQAFGEYDGVTVTVWGFGGPEVSS